MANPDNSLIEPVAEIDHRGANHEPELPGEGLSFSVAKFGVTSITMALLCLSIGDYSVARVTPGHC
ncbi:MAG: hypothetical protein WCG59_01600 [Actinomycetes bacterium]